MNWKIETGNMKVKVDLGEKQPYECWDEIMDALNLARTEESMLGSAISANKEGADEDDAQWWKVTNKFVKALNKRVDITEKSKKGKK